MIGFPLQRNTGSEARSCANSCTVLFMPPKLEAKATLHATTWYEYLIFAPLALEPSRTRRRGVILYLTCRKELSSPTTLARTRCASEAVISSDPHSMSRCSLHGQPSRTTSYMQHSLSWADIGNAESCCCPCSDIRCLASSSWLCREANSLVPLPKLVSCATNTPFPDSSASSNIQSIGLFPFSLRENHCSSSIAIAAGVILTLASVMV
mmetsp:Transcript_33212/g.77379  ORF Transcript_33212/g.77379 Transcript_33212/m.77379 type:complete len:209 (+) Transcript_33212:221-847(+)